VYAVDSPTVVDAEAVSRMQLRAWLQTYPDADAGIDDEWILEQHGYLDTAEGIALWRDAIAAAARQPERYFCRVVRSGTDVVGVLYGRREELVTLGPMYLLDEAKGSGVAHRLMDDFLGWAGDSPMRLWVTEYNERAIRFYSRYGFVATDERELWRGRLLNVRMVRAARSP